MDNPDQRFPYGTQWLHFWTVAAPHGTELAMAMQWEHVGIAISGAPYIMLRPSQAQRFLDTMAAVPGSVKDDTGVSIPLGE